MQKLTPQEHAQLDAERKAQQARIHTEVQATHLNEIHTHKKEGELLCENCSKTIPQGAKYRQQKIPIGYGFLEGTHFRYRITHLVCCVEAKKQ
jgi:hypothetical protein